MPKSTYDTLIDNKVPLLEGQTVINWYPEDWYYWMNYYDMVNWNFRRLDANTIYPKKNKCNICKVKGQTYVHHIVPISRGGCYNRIDNMIEVCLLCHCQIHKFSMSRLNHKLKEKIGYHIYSDILSMLKAVPMEQKKALERINFD